MEVMVNLRTHVAYGTLLPVLVRRVWGLVYPGAALLFQPEPVFPPWTGGGGPRQSRPGLARQNQGPHAALLQIGRCQRRLRVACPRLLHSDPGPLLSQSAAHLHIPGGAAAAHGCTARL